MLEYVCIYIYAPLEAAAFSQNAIAKRQRRTEVINHHAVILVAGALLATRKLAQIAENVELMVRNLDEALEQDPGDALVAGWSRQRAEVGPVAVVVGQQLARVDGIVHLDTVVLVGDVGQQTRDLVHLLVRFSHLEKDPEHGQSIGRLSGLRERLVLARVPVYEVQLASKGLTVDGVLRAPGIAATPMAVVLLELVDVVHEGTSAEEGTLAVRVHSPAVPGIDELARRRRRILPSQWLAAERLVIGLGAIGLDVDGTLPRARGHREFLYPCAGSFLTGVVPIPKAGHRGGRLAEIEVGEV